MNKKYVNQLDRLDDENLFNLPVSKYFENREFISEEKRWVDFCSCNYLSFEFDKKVLDLSQEFQMSWGAMPCWARMEADPIIYRDLESRINKFLGADECMLSHTITITNFSIIPGIVKKGVCITDHKVHTVVWEACRLARDHGATIERFAHQDLNSLEDVLKKNRNVQDKLVAVDGVYSISTDYAHVKEMQFLCKKYNAWLYIDDAHGFGILGKNPTDDNPHGVGGAGIVSYAGGDYDRTFYVTNFGKAFSAPMAFSTIPKEFTENVKAFSMQYLFSAPCSPPLVGAINGVLDLNETIGEERRKKIRDLVQYFTTQLKELNISYHNNQLHPVVFVKIGEIDDLIVVANRFKEIGIHAGLRAYPVVPPDRCGFRFAITAFNTKEQIDKILSVFSENKIKQVIKS